MKVIVAGGGPGSALYMTEATAEAVKKADLVLTSKHLEETIIKMNGSTEVKSVSDTVSYIKEHCSDEMSVCIVASGDTGFYSIAGTLKRELDNIADIQLLPGIGSLSYFAAALGTGYENVRLVSLHGINKSIIPFVCYNEWVFALTGGEKKAGTVIHELYEAGFGNLRISVGENLSLENERIVTASVSELDGMSFDDLSVMMIENRDCIRLGTVFRDDDFLRAKVPMTKGIIRNASVDKLEIKPTDIVYDIGAGTGSVTCAMALRANESMVYAIEKSEVAVDLIKKNIQKTGARNIVLKQGKAPDGIESFPAPDKVFIGGSAGNLESIIKAVLRRNEDVVFVVNAITLETFYEAVHVFEAEDMECEVLQLAVSRKEALGSYSVMKADNPVYIIKGEKKSDK